MKRGTILNVALAASFVPQVCAVFAELHRGGPVLVVAGAFMGLTMVFGSAAAGARALANIGWSDKTLQHLIAGAWVFASISQIGVLATGIMSSSVPGTGFFQYLGSAAWPLVLAALASCELVVVANMLGDNLDDRASRRGEEEQRLLQVLDANRNELVRKLAAEQQLVRQLQSENERLLASCSQLRDENSALALTANEASGLRHENAALKMTGLNDNTKRAVELLGGQWLTPRQLAEEMGIEAATAQAMLGRLLERKLVERRLDEGVRGRAQYHYRATVPEANTAELSAAKDGDQ